MQTTRRCLDGMRQTCDWHAMRREMQGLVEACQLELVDAVGRLDARPFRRDVWRREEGGGGITCVLQEGEVFEKAGINVSSVFGTLPQNAIAAMAGGALHPADFATAESRAFFATGISCVLHPHNPMAPTAHCNFRYFELGPHAEAWWFGGGADLTPAYLFEDDARHFHGALKGACDRHDATYYPRFKKWCDEYFQIPHRHETRGIGGIFFDHLCDRPQDALFTFVSDCARSFAPAYLPLVQRRHDMPYSDEQKRWQALRRGRYVEFNLVYDRGTTFGLRTGGRTESILMSLPLSARWEYDVNVQPESEEARLLAVLQAPREWT